MINFIFPGTFLAAGGDAWPLCRLTNPLLPLISPASKSRSLSTDAFKSLGDTKLGLHNQGELTLLQTGLKCDTQIHHLTLPFPGNDS